MSLKNQSVYYVFFKSKVTSDRVTFPINLLNINKLHP